MNNNTKTNLLQSILIGLLFGFSLVSVFVLKAEVQSLRTDLKEITRGPTMEFREADLAINERLDEQAHVNGVIQDQLDTLQENWEFYTGRHNNRIQALEYEVFHNSYPIINFPWISQRGDGAREYEADCASAVALMIATYYEVDGGETVDYVHSLMAGGDHSVDWYGLNKFLQGYFQLETQVVVTDQALLDNLENLYNDVSDIEVVEDVPRDVPVAWIYAQTPHWIVRFKEWSYDPGMGMWPFEDTVNIYKPERGLGIIVTEVKGGNK